MDKSEKVIKSAEDALAFMNEKGAEGFIIIGQTLGEKPLMMVWTNLKYLSGVHQTMRDAFEIFKNDVEFAEESDVTADKKN